MNWVFVTTTAFLTECVAQQAAGAFALGNMLRNPGAAIAAVIIPSLVSRMGSGWCFTGLALLDFVLVGSAVLGRSFFRTVIVQEIIIANRTPSPTVQRPRMEGHPSRQNEGSQCSQVKREALGFSSTSRK